jgi:hypothetical protein
MLVEDEVTDAIVDRFALILLDGLERMRMMTYEGIGTSVYEIMRLLTLQRNRFECMLTSPMERDDDETLRVLLF